MSKKSQGVTAMRICSLGHLLFAASVAGIGILSLISGDFAFQWQPVPDWIPWREGLAYASGVLMLTCAAGMIVKRSAALSALVITAYLLTWVLMLQAPRVARVPVSVGMWLDFCESLFLMCGGWIVFTSLVEPGSRL